MGFTAEQKTKFDALYASADTMHDDARLVQLKDEMLKILVESNEARRKFMHPKSVVPHSKNRGGSRMTWRKIFEKGSKIIKVGVSLQQCGPDRAVAFESTADDADAFVELCRTSEHYARFDRDQVDGASVGCGHWNQFLACCIDGVKVPEEFRDRLC